MMCLRDSFNLEVTQVCHKTAKTEIKQIDVTEWWGLTTDIQWDPAMVAMVFLSGLTRSLTFRAGENGD